MVSALIILMVVTTTPGHSRATDTTGRVGAPGPGEVEKLECERGSLEGPGVPGMDAWEQTTPAAAILLSARRDVTDFCPGIRGRMGWLLGCGCTRRGPRGLPTVAVCHLGLCLEPCMLLPATVACWRVGRCIP